MNNLSELYFVTGNPVKFEEVSLFFTKYAPHIIIKQLDVDLPEVQTVDQHAIALDKARQAWNLLKKPVMVDDTAIYFEKYPDFPGTMAKFIYKTIGLDGIFKLMEDGDHMYIRIVFVFMYEENSPSIIEHTTHGTFTKSQRLDLHRKDAPFDTVFIPEGVTETVDILLEQGKAEPYQYRMKALHKFVNNQS